MNAISRIKSRAIFIVPLLLYLGIVAGAGSSDKLTREGLVEHIGAQKNIMDTGKADGTMELRFFEGKDNMYAVGPAAGLDGEITLRDSKPYVSKVRGNDYSVDNTLNHDALFLVWAQVPDWKEVGIADDVKNYIELQEYIKEQASALGIDVSMPFPFQVSGTPAEILWHINVDRTEGKQITRELFVKSKEIYTIHDEPVDIVGFYSENHYGVFISQYAPATKPDSGAKNAVHMHFISRSSKAAGHVDDIALTEGMTLFLPETK
jgi:acetolactate decarboxylase